MTTKIYVASIVLLFISLDVARLLADNYRSLKCAGLEDKAIWNLSNGGKIIVNNGANGPIFTFNDTPITLGSSNESAFCAVLSPKESALLVLLRGRRPSNNEVHYVGLALIVRAPSGGWILSGRSLTEADLKSNDCDWVIDLGAISDNGRVALVQIGRRKQIAPEGYLINYPWMTWDLQEKKILKEGLEIPSEFWKLGGM